MIRYALQAELFGLSAAQRTNGANQVNAAIANETIVPTEPAIIDPNKTIRGDVMLFVEANFTTRAGADRIFDTARDWAATRAGDAASGRHSYVRLRVVDDVARTIVERYAESPGWVASVTTLPLDSARTG